MSDIIESVRSDLQGLSNAGFVSKTTMRDFNEKHPVATHTLRPMTAKDVKTLRERLCISQPVLAQYLNTSSSTVKKWEHGQTTPTGSALKLLDLINRKGLSAVS